MHTEDQKQIYRVFHDGKKYVDPLSADKKLSMYMNGDPNKVIADMRSGVPELAIPAQEAFSRAVCLSFGLPLFDAATGEGTLEHECLRLWNEFQDWMQKKSESQLVSATSPQPTLGAFESPSSPTSCTSDSTSTSSECGCDEAGK